MSERLEVKAFSERSPRIMWFTVVYPWFRALKHLGLSPELDATGKRKRLRPFGPEAWLAESRERILRRRRRSKKENALWVAVCGLRGHLKIRKEADETETEVWNRLKWRIHGGLLCKSYYLLADDCHARAFLAMRCFTDDVADPVFEGFVGAALVEEWPRRSRGARLHGLRPHSIEGLPGSTGLHERCAFDIF